jgi:hypothetical protein
VQIFMAASSERITTNGEQAAAIWAELKRHLSERSRALKDEVRNYPTPIARCDEQLTKLLEQRDRAVATIELIRDLDAATANANREAWLSALGAFLAQSAPDVEDAVEIAIRARLRAAVAARGDPKTVP